MPGKKSIFQTVREKRAWQDPDHAPGTPFRGWHTRGYLPHFDAPGVLQMVTWRLDDAMPAERRHEWEPLRAIQDERERRTKLEEYLDRGHGSCALRDPRVASLVEGAFHFFDAERYRLAAWVVMPNHVHVLIEQWETPLAEVLHSWKRHTSLATNRLLGRTGRLWQPEYWDRYMRDEAHCHKAVHYIEWNPVKAGLAREPAQWPHGSAHPKWEWQVGGERQLTRYHGGHVRSANWEKFYQHVAEWRGEGARVSNPAEAREG